MAFRYNKAGELIEYDAELFRLRKWKIQFSCLKCDFVSKIKHTQLSLGEEFALPVCLDCGSNLMAIILFARPKWNKPAYEKELKTGYTIEKYLKRGQKTKGGNDEGD